MTLLEMIKEWRNGCSCTLCGSLGCSVCTDALINAMENKLTFNYPECLNRIVDVAVERAEKETLKFKKIDEHKEMMSRMSKPVAFYDPNPNPYAGGGGGYYLNDREAERFLDNR